MARMYSKVFYNNGIIDSKDANLSIASSAVLYGLSVYTVFPVSLGDNGELLIFRLEDHYQRLINSAKIIGIDTFASEWTFKKFKKVAVNLINVNDIKRDVYVRATVHVDEELAGTKSRGLCTNLSIFIYDANPILSKKGSRLKTSVWRRIPDFAIPSRAKVNGAYVNSVLAKQDAIDSGYDDCIFLDIQGHVCELSAANIFLVRNGALITPDANSDLLEGINRSTVLQLAKEDLKMQIVQRSVDLTELYVADEVFASGTSVNIAPVLEIDARGISDGKIGPITKKLQQIHQDLRHGKYKNSRGWLTKLEIKVTCTRTLPNPPTHPLSTP